MKQEDLPLVATRTWDVSVITSVFASGMMALLMLLLLGHFQAYTETLAECPAQFENSADI